MQIDFGHFGQMSRRRLATVSGAVALGLVALAFATAADAAQRLFDGIVHRSPYSPLLITPIGFALLAALTFRLAPAARGSGIPQVIVASQTIDTSASDPLISLRTAAFKFGLTVLTLGVGGSVGREGPTVQISAAVMGYAHRLFRVPLTAGAVIAGGAAGVAAAFNTPLAGVAFAIEELASAYEQKVTLLVMAAVMISGLVSLGISGDYLYFGAMHETLAIGPGLLIAPVAGILGGTFGSLFSRAILAFGRSQSPFFVLVRQRRILLAAACGLAIAVLGIVTTGETWGTGYAPARSLIEGGDLSPWFGPAKFAATLLTTISGMPGGIFAPSLATGAGVGHLMAGWFPQEPAGAVVLLGMIAYFVGVVRAPLTAVIIVSEMTGSRAMILPLFLAAICAEGVAALLCPEKLYHGLTPAFRAPREKVPDMPPML